MRDTSIKNKYTREHLYVIQQRLDKERKRMTLARQSHTILTEEKDSFILDLRPYDVPAFTGEIVYLHDLIAEQDTLIMKPVLPTYEETAVIPLASLPLTPIPEIPDMEDTTYIECILPSTRTEKPHTRFNWLAVALLLIMAFVAVGMVLAAIIAFRS